MSIVTTYGPYVTVEGISEWSLYTDIANTGWSVILCLVRFNVIVIVICYRYTPIVKDGGYSGLDSCY